MNCLQDEVHFYPSVNSQSLKFQVLFEGLKRVHKITKLNEKSMDLLKQFE